MEDIFRVSRFGVFVCADQETLKRRVFHLELCVILFGVVERRRNLGIVEWSTRTFRGFGNKEIFGHKVE